MTDGEAPARPRKSWWIRIGLLLASLLLAELAMRAMLAVRGAGYDAAATATGLVDAGERFGGQAFQDLLEHDGDDEGRLSHPFYAWETGVGLEQIDRHYAEGNDVAGYEVWLLGGSVAEIFGQPEQGANRLAELLGADPRLSGPVLVRNYGRSSFKQPQQLMVLSYLLSLGLVPDAVVNLDGFNEVAIGVSNARSGTHPTYPSVPMWGALQIDPDSDARLARRVTAMSERRDRARRIASTTLKLGLYRSAILGSAALAWVRREQGAWMAMAQNYATELERQARRPLLRGPDLGARADDVPGVVVTNWVESSRTIQSICAARSIAYLHVLQPTLHDAGSKTPTAEEQQLVPLNDAWLEGVRVGYPLLREAGARLREHGIAFFDASRVFADVEETLYIDPIHFADAGNRLLAERIATAFLEQLAD